MELPITSLVPTVVELVTFIEQNWPHIWWFPNWYLGVPLRFVTGPVVPILTILLNRLTGLSIEIAYISLIGLISLVGSYGVRIFARVLGAGRKTQWLVAAIFLLWPFHILLLTYGNGLHHLTTFLLPWYLWAWARHLKARSRNYPWLTAGLATLLLLIDVASFLPLIVSTLVVILMNRHNDAWEKGVVKGTLVILTALSLSTIWYTPRFWWVLLGNPSFGGKPLSNVIPFILQFIQATIPLVLGAWVVQKRYRLRDKLTQFGVLFGGSFLFLTLIRFMSDVDFWMDWTGYFLELQLVIAILGGVVIFRYLKRWYAILIMISILTIIDGVVVYTSFKTNTTFKSYKEKITQIIRQQVEPGQRVFLSGSPVFWLGKEHCAINTSDSVILANEERARPEPVLNSIQESVPSADSGVVASLLPRMTKLMTSCSILQVRGGRDEVSIHKTWAMGAYNIREGDDAELMKNWLTAIGVSHLLVHERDSQEYYRDFKNLERFGSLTPASESNGDVLYKIDASFGRWVDSSILQMTPPKEGNDEVALSNYVNSIGEEVKAGYVTPTKIAIELDSFEKQYISLAATFDRRWQVKEVGVRLAPDALGNIVAIPSNEVSRMTLEYKEIWFDTWFGVGISGLCILLLIKSERVTAWIRQKVPSITSSEDDEEQQY